MAVQVANGTVQREQATVVKPDPIRSEARAMYVVDTDFHVKPKMESLRKYMSEPFKSKILSYPLGGAEYDARYAINLENDGLSVQGEASSADDILRVLDEIAVDTVVTGPGLRPVAYFTPVITDALASAYNDFLIHEVFPRSDRIKGTILINQRDPESAAREIRRVGQHAGFVGVYAEFGAAEQIATARFDPMYDALQEFEFPLVMHASGFWPQRSFLSTGTRTWIEGIGVAWPAFAMATLAAMICQGLFDKYPKQKVLMQEGGLWWLVDFMLRMDEFYLDHPNDIQMTERKLESGEKFLKRLPSEYVREHFFFSTQPMAKPKNAKHFAWLMELINGKDALLYSSDWPHATFDPVNWVVENSSLPEDVQRDILAGNALKFFPRLAGLAPSVAV